MIFRLLGAGVALTNHLRLLPRDALFEVLLSPRRDDLFIGGVASGAAESVVLYTGGLRPLVVPRGWFTARPGGPKPDFDDLEVIDYGQTVRLGAYEAAADALLYEFDAAYRRRAKRAFVEADTTFGGALKRLRLQRGLERTEIAGVSARTVARIERGEVGRPRGRTLERLAKALKVRPKEIGGY